MPIEFDKRKLAATHVGTLYNHESHSYVSGLLRGGEIFGQNSWFPPLVFSFDRHEGPWLLFEAGVHCSGSEHVARGRKSRGTRDRTLRSGCFQDRERVRQTPKTFGEW